MASFAGYPQTVNFQTVNMSSGGGSENLLINPRGKINQANEPDGVLSAGQYFCDGWKAGAAGAEVYVDPDGFRLISGSIVQLVPNNLEAGRTIRGNMDIISGAPVISINGGGDNVLSDNAEYIQFEVSGNNTKFNRLILAESVSLPIYQQSQDELSPCLKFLNVSDANEALYGARSDYSYANYYFEKMHKIPAVTVGSFYQGSQIQQITKSKVQFANTNAVNIAGFTGGIVLDARP